MNEVAKDRTLIAIRMDSEMREQLRLIAEEDCCGVSVIVRKACRDYIQKRTR